MKSLIDLYGLQGFGNILIETVASDSRYEISRYITRREEYPNPYWKQNNLLHLINEFGCNPIFVEQKSEIPYFPVSPYAIVSSFHKIFPPALLNRYKLVVNIHPSYLPQYRGPTPTRRMILDNCELGGVTAHVMTSDIDAGPIISQMKINISKCTDGETRRRIAEASRLVIVDVLNFLTQQYNLDSLPIPIEGETHKRVLPEDHQICANMTIEKASLILRAFSPFPGAIVNIDGWSEYRVSSPYRENFTETLPLSNGTLRVVRW